MDTIEIIEFNNTGDPLLDGTEVGVNCLELKSPPRHQSRGALKEETTTTIVTIVVSAKNGWT